MSLLRRVREFWYNNEPGPFRVEGVDISRRLIQVYGGPAGDLECEQCQKAEWLSRLLQKNMWDDFAHKCKFSDATQERCSKQGGELWVHWHQDFSFMHRCDRSLSAPTCAFLAPELTRQRWHGPICDQGVINWRRQFAQACQMDMVNAIKKGVENEYDFLFLIVRPGYDIRRPDMPVVLYGHDLWKIKSDLQSCIDMVQPDYFLTPFPSSWRAKYRFPKRTKIRFHCLSPGSFLSRPNLGKKQKRLLLAGTVSDKIYAPRRRLMEWVKANIDDATIWRNVGHIRNFHKGPARTEKLRYLNWWSALIAEHKFAMFGPIADEIQPVFFKHYEYLASGAVPIFPESPDFSHLGIEAMKHYIPLKTAMNGRDKFAHFFSHYPEYKGIAENAVEWSRQSADRMLFGGFEDLVQEVTGGAFPRRLA